MPIDFQLASAPPARVQAASIPSFDDQYARVRALATDRLFPANAGRSDDPLSLVGGRARSGGGGGNWVRYFTPQWGGKIGATFSRSASGAGGNERGLSFALYRRW